MVQSTNKIFSETWTQNKTNCAELQACLVGQNVGLGQNMNQLVPTNQTMTAAVSLNAMAHRFHAPTWG